MLLMRSFPFRIDTHWLCMPSGESNTATSSTLSLTLRSVFETSTNSIFFKRRRLWCVVPFRHCIFHPVSLTCSRDAYGQVVEMFDKIAKRATEFGTARISFPEESEIKLKPEQASRGRKGSASGVPVATQLHIGPEEQKTILVHISVDMKMKALQMLLGLYGGVQSQSAGGGRRSADNVAGAIVDTLVKSISLSSRNISLSNTAKALQSVNFASWGSKIRSLNFRRAAQATSTTMRSASVWFVC